jgi:hypothetical protein
LQQYRDAYEPDASIELHKLSERRVGMLINPAHQLNYFERVTAPHPSPSTWRPRKTERISIAPGVLESQLDSEQFRPQER